MNIINYKRILKRVNNIQTRLYFLIYVACIVIGCLTQDYKLAVMCLLGIIVSMYSLFFRLVFKIKFSYGIQIFTSDVILMIFLIGLGFGLFASSYSYAFCTQFLLDMLIYLFTLIFFEQIYLKIRLKRSGDTTRKTRNQILQDYAQIPKVLKMLSASSITITILMFCLFIKYFCYELNNVTGTTAFQIIYHILINSAMVIVIATSEWLYGRSKIYFVKKIKEKN